MATKKLYTDKDNYSVIVGHMAYNAAGNYVYVERGLVGSITATILFTFLDPDNLLSKMASINSIKLYATSECYELPTPLDAAYCDSTFYFTIFQTPTYYDYDDDYTHFVTLGTDDFDVTHTTDPKSGSAFVVSGLLTRVKLKQVAVLFCT